jgi:glycerol uptake facilitator-like aquaporin
VFVSLFSSVHEGNNQRENRGNDRGNDIILHLNRFWNFKFGEGLVLYIFILSAVDCANIGPACTLTKWAKSMMGGFGRKRARKRFASANGSKYLHDVLHMKVVM